MEMTDLLECTLKVIRKGFNHEERVIDLNAPTPFNLLFVLSTTSNSPNISSQNRLSSPAEKFSVFWMAFEMKMVLSILFEEIQTLPFIPTATSNLCFFPRFGNSLQSGERILLTVWIGMLTTKDGWFEGRTPIPSLFRFEVMQTNSVSISRQGLMTRAKTTSPTWSIISNRIKHNQLTLISGRFFLVAPSNANRLRDARSFAPMSTRALNPPLLTTVPTTLSPLIGIYYRKRIISVWFRKRCPTLRWFESTQKTSGRFR